MKRKCFLPLLVVVFNVQLQTFAGGYGGFRVSVYARAYEVREMGDLKKLDSLWAVISGQVKVDKIYLETHRDGIILDDKTIETAKRFFEGRGVIVAGGITYTMDEHNRFETFCYSNPEHRKKVKDIAEITARHFDEFILDDFFFTNCKCKLCFTAKGTLSWTQYRLNLMKGAAEELVVRPAKAVNPKVKVVIKFPNWYEHFQGLGFDLENEPMMFDGVYTGTETRDPAKTAQHLQQYQGYLIFRYLENIKPGGNGGGWVDTGAMFYLDRYAEQLWLTLFAKAPEITLFDFRQLRRPVYDSDRAQWQSEKPSFDFDEMMKRINVGKGNAVVPTTIASAAGYTLETVDKFIERLGNPTGVKSYKPFHSTGEDFLHNFLGMIGVPIDLVPTFPADSKMILLTESAKFDTGIVSKIRSRLLAGKNVMMTSGLLKALRGKRIEDIAEVECLDRKSLAKDFVVGRDGYCSAKEKVLIPQIHYYTNDSWEDISALDFNIGWPLLLQAGYAKGSLFVLTIPESFVDLYNLPADVLNRIRQVMSQDINIRLAGCSQVALFVYDNDTFIVESFLPEDVSVKVIIGKEVRRIQDIISGEKLSGKAGQDVRVFGRDTDDVSTFDVALKPHSYRVFHYE
jgi:hypothetical protein